MRQTAIDIVKKLQGESFEAFLVGGCVRDILLGLEPEDYDIATNARPEQVEQIFKKSFAIGKSFGVILIEEEGHHFEIATFREDGEYLDGRRPESVDFSDSKEDALRRDFTINGLFYDPVVSRVIDYVGGKKDLDQKIIQFIGDPDQRINEDFLRILRAIRFKNRFGFNYDSETGKALKRHASLVTQIATERILSELNKILVQKNRGSALRDMYQFGVLSKLFPNVDFMHDTDQPKDHHQEGNVLTHTFLVLDQLEPGDDLALYWAAFFHDFAKPKTRVYKDGRWRYPGHDDVVLDQVQSIFKKYTFPKKLAQKIYWLLEHKPIFENYGDMKLATKLKYFDHLYFEDLWKLERADIMGSIPEDETSHQEVLREMDQIWDNYNYAHTNKILPSYKKEFFTGAAIMKITGLKPGKRVGELKAQLRALQLEGEIVSLAKAEEWLGTQL